MVDQEFNTIMIPITVSKREMFIGLAWHVELLKKSNKKMNEVHVLEHFDLSKMFEISCDVLWIGIR